MLLSHVSGPLRVTGWVPISQLEAQINVNWEKNYGVHLWHIAVVDSWSDTVE